MTRADVLVVVPVLGRPDRVKPLLESLAASQETVTVRALFVASPEDRPEIEALRHAGAVFLVTSWPAGVGDWARKINLAMHDTTEPWLLTGADDLCFCPGWADRALECAERSGAQVVGTNDLGNPRVTSGQHATHNLIARAYAVEQGTIDRPGLAVHEGYDHNFVDDELVATAQARRAWTFCAAAEVPHLHPNWGKGQRDATYEKGEARFEEDRRLFYRRRRLWRRVR